MQTMKFDSSEANNALVGMIVDPVVLGRVAAVWRTRGLFESEWQNRLAEIALDFYRRYSTAPNGKFAGLFQSASVKWSSEDLQLAERLVAALPAAKLSDDSRPLLDLVEKVILRADYRRRIEEAQEAINRDDLDSARVALESPAPAITPQEPLRLCVDFEPWSRAFNEQEMRDVVEYPGPLYSFMSGMSRGTLFSFMGPDKSGKSFLLLDLVYRAIRQQKRVAYFEVGDLGEQEVVTRLAERSCRRPRRADCYYKVPKFGKDGEVGFERLKTGRSSYLSPGDGFREMGRWSRGADALRLSCHAAGTLSVAGMRTILADWDRVGWKPDAVVIDYADILAPPQGLREINDQLDETWKQLRRLSQELDALTVTATQVKADAYKTKGLLSMWHFSGRKTKLAHVNGMIGINPNKDKTFTLNWVVRRSGEKARPVRVAPCFAAAWPIAAIEEPKKTKPSQPTDDPPPT